MKIRSSCKNWRCTKDSARWLFMLQLTLPTSCRIRGWTGIWIRRLIFYSMCKFRSCLLSVSNSHLMSKFGNPIAASPSSVDVRSAAVENDALRHRTALTYAPLCLTPWPSGHRPPCVPTILSDPVPPWLAGILGWRQSNYLNERHGGHSLGFITVHFTIIFYQVAWVWRFFVCLFLGHLYIGRCDCWFF